MKFSTKIQKFADTRKELVKALEEKLNAYLKQTGSRQHKITLDPDDFKHVTIQPGWGFHEGQNELVITSQSFCHDPHYGESETTHRIPVLYADDSEAYLTWREEEHAKHKAFAAEQQAKARKLQRAHELREYRRLEKKLKKEGRL